MISERVTRRAAASCFTSRSVSRSILMVYMVLMVLYYTNRITGHRGCQARTSVLAQGTRACALQVGGGRIRPATRNLHERTGEMHERRRDHRPPVPLQPPRVAAVWRPAR